MRTNRPPIGRVIASTLFLLICSSGVANNPGLPPSEVCPEGYVKVKITVLDSTIEACLNENALSEAVDYSEVPVNPQLCPRPIVFVTIEIEDVRLAVCVQGRFGHWPYFDLLDVLIQFVPPSGLPTDHLDRCPKSLGDLPYPIGFIRHDDIESYWKDGSDIEDPSVSGFYAKNSVDAMLSALKFMSLEAFYYVPGEVRHTKELYCTNIQEVPYYLWKLGRINAKTNTWSNYHLIVRNCQHWATHILKATGLE